MAETFEEKMEAMKGFSEDEMAKKIQEVKETCKSFCGECPTYTETGETELGFCATSKSKIIIEEKECLCPSCPVTGMMSLRWEYYCTRGSGREQAAAGKQ